MNPKEEKNAKINTNIVVIKIIAIILGVLIILGLIGLFIGLVINYKKSEQNTKNKINYINTEIEQLVIFDFFEPKDAQLISTSMGINNEILLRYLYKGKNVLVVLDKKTKKKKAIITLTKGLNTW